MMHITTALERTTDKDGNRISKITCSCGSTRTATTTADAIQAQILHAENEEAIEREKNPHLNHEVAQVKFSRTAQTIGSARTITIECQCGWRTPSCLTWTSAGLNYDDHKDLVSRTKLK